MNFKEFWINRPKFKHSEFSKILLIQESALIWIITIAFIILAFACVFNGFIGSLPWLSAMVCFPWTAYGVSQACYYNKSKAENTTGGIKFENAFWQYQQTQYNTDSSVIDENIDMPI